MHKLISSSILHDKGFLSASMYSGETIRSPVYDELENFLNDKNPYEIGFEPSSRAYLSMPSDAACKFIRTKALSEDYYLTYFRGGAIIDLSPKFKGEFTVSEGDVLLSKDSNVGQVSIVPEGNWSKTYFSGGVVKLNIKRDKFFLISFLKTKLFRNQVEGMTPRGATIKHAGTRWLKCKVPLPHQENAELLIDWISCISQAIIDCEQTIISKDNNINELVDTEIRNNQKSCTTTPNHIVSSKSVFESARFDGAFHSQECRQLLNLAKNYKNGSISPDSAGFDVIPGPTLEIKIIKKRLDSKVQLPGYYELFIPKNISEYGSMVKTSYLGTPVKLPYLKKGDVLVGEAGFKKGRSTIYLGKDSNATTNAHGLIIRKRTLNIKESIVFRCIINWYRSTGLFDLLAVGGSGGHLSPSYFPLLQLPQFPESIKNQLNDYYVGECLNKPESNKSPSNWLKESKEHHKSTGLMYLTEINKKRRALLEETFEKLSIGKTIQIEELKQSILDCNK